MFGGVYDYFFGAEPSNADSTATRNDAARGGGGATTTTGAAAVGEDQDWCFVDRESRLD